jgi:hypothetical protein
MHQAPMNLRQLLKQILPPRRCLPDPLQLCLPDPPQQCLPVQKAQLKLKKMAQI